MNFNGLLALVVAGMFGGILAVTLGLWLGIGRHVAAAVSCSSDSRLASSVCSAYCSSSVGSWVLHEGNENEVGSPSMNVAAGSRPTHHEPQSRCTIAASNAGRGKKTGKDNRRLEPMEPHASCYMPPASSDCSPARSPATATPSPETGRATWRCAFLKVVTGACVHRSRFAIDETPVRS